jgi:hypothetical protein
VAYRDGKFASARVTYRVILCEPGLSRPIKMVNSGSKGGVSNESLIDRSFSIFIPTIDRPCLQGEEQTYALAYKY